MATTARVPVDASDPEAAWQPWEPDRAHPWNLQWAGHLYRRATFGASLDELRQAVGDGLPKTLNRIVDGPSEGTADRQDFLQRLGQTIAQQNNPNALRAWWLYCMLHSNYPFREKMTLFWHNHFVSSITKVTSAELMLQQNITLREHALGKFPPFLLAMSKNPAMLIYLDSNSNVKGKPNENYAREVMELFSLGVGNYTEKDIREAARAFTGWHTSDGAFEFADKFHDFGTKTVLKQTGKWNGEDVVRILMEQPAAARFLVRKLYTFFVSEAAVPSDAFLEPLADTFRKSGYDIKAVVRQILASRYFYSQHAYRQRIKSPVEFVLGAVWSLTDRQIPQATLISQLELMGQNLFAPPNVKGWPGGKYWLNTSTVLARHNFALHVASSGLHEDRSVMRGATSPAEAARLRALEREREALRAQEEARLQAEEARLRAEGKPVPPRPVPKEPALPPPPANMDIASLARRQKATTPAAIVKLLCEVLLQGTIQPEAQKELVAFVGKGKPAGPTLDQRIREATHMIMTMPEYQLA